MWKNELFIVKTAIIMKENYVWESIKKRFFLSKKEILYVDTISFTYKQLSDKKHNSKN